MPGSEQGHGGCRCLIKADVIRNLDHVYFWKMGNLRKPTPQGAGLEAPDSPLVTVIFTTIGTSRTNSARHIRVRDNSVPDFDSGNILPHGDYFTGCIGT
jgi:hypothetical protein